MPPSALTSSGGRASSRSSVRHESAPAPALTTSVPMKCRWSRTASSPIAVSGRTAAAPSTRIRSLTIWRRYGPRSVSCTLAAARRDSVDSMAGCPAGYSDTARAAALHVRAKSPSRAASSGASTAGTAGSVIEWERTRRERRAACFSGTRRNSSKFSSIVVAGSGAGGTPDSRARPGRPAPNTERRQRARPGRRARLTTQALPLRF